MIAWHRDTTDMLLNPRLAAADRKALHRLIDACPAPPGHLWLTTSGATGRLKPVALAKAALLAAADAVNHALAATRDDRWCRPLPLFHVGGLGIHARAWRSGSAVHVLEPWDPVAFLDMLADESITLTSVVPTQLRDLLAQGLASPPALRAMLVGGGALADELARAARASGWPIIPTYGTTETAAAVALGQPLALLPHVEARVVDGRLAFRGPSLLTGYATAQGLDDPKRDGWWTSSDLGAVDGRTLRVLGRADDVVKVGGEAVALGALQARLEALLPGSGVRDAAVRARRDDRLGQVVVMQAVGPRADVEALRQRYDAIVLPFERARAVELVQEIPRTALGKVRRGRD